MAHQLFQRGQILRQIHLTAQRTVAFLDHHRKAENIHRAAQKPAAFVKFHLQIGHRRDQRARHRNAMPRKCQVGSGFVVAQAHALRRIIYPCAAPLHRFCQAHVLVPKQHEIRR